jgi:hypothetical protein
MRAKITSTSPIAHATREKYYEFALREYNASIKYLIDIGRHDKLSIADQETMLLSSLLFAGLSSIQCDYEQATTHAHNGINLFYEWRFWERADDALASKASHVLPTESLISLFAHFESQFTNRRRLDWRPQWPTLIMPESCSSEPYKTVTEAQYDFQRLLTSFLRWSGNTETSVWVLPSATPDFLGRYSAEFRLWRAKFDEFLASSYRHPSNQEAISYLQLHWLAVEICLRIDYAEGVLAWDKHTSQFIRIAELAQGAFDDIMGKRDKAGADYIGFSYSMSICEVLYFTGINCRDREIQRSVIRLLRKWPRRDGVWDSVFIANLIQARRDVEENATRRDGVPKVENCTCIDGTFVCVDHRVCYQDVEFLQDGTIQITLTTVYAFENNLPPIVVIMDTI